MYLWVTGCGPVSVVGVGENEGVETGTGGMEGLNRRRVAGVPETKGTNPNLLAEEE